MDLVPPLMITPVLRAAAEFRFEEFEHMKTSFKQRYRLHKNYNRDGEIKTISGLLEDIKLGDPDLQNDEHDFDVENFTRFVNLARDDTSISEEQLQCIRSRLQCCVEKRRKRMEVASLHISLMREAMNVVHTVNATSPAAAQPFSCDGFEVVDSELERAVDEFETNAFTDYSVDMAALEDHLSTLFDNSTDGAALQNLRIEMNSFAAEVMADGLEADQDGLMWTIIDLLKNELVNPDLKLTLEGFLQSPIALRELVATLNTRTFRDWNYKNAHLGLPVVARRDSNDQYCIVVEEDLMDMIFLHCTAMSWAASLKTGFKHLVSRSTHLNSKLITPQESCKQNYYLAQRRRINSKMRRSPCKMCGSIAAPPPPMPYPPPPPPPLPPGMLNCPGVPIKILDFTSPLSPRHGVLDMERGATYKERFFLSHLPLQEDTVPKAPNAETIQSEIIKILAAEARLRCSLDGKVHSLAVRIPNLSSLPHGTILTVLKFLGLPADFLAFFERVLVALLKVATLLTGRTKDVEKRVNGVTPGHRMELFFREAVLSFLDLSIHKRTGAYLYRTADQLNFVGTAHQTQTARGEIERFAKITGLRFEDVQDSGSLSIGFLDLHDDTGTFHINTTKVLNYAQNTKIKLDACTTVLDWIRVWNNTIGTYPAHLLGPLTDGLGKAHLDAVKAAYNLMYTVIFNNGNLTLRVTKMLLKHTRSSRIDTLRILDSLDAIIYMPQAHGGLGVKNPFITFQLSDKIAEKPEAVLEQYKQDEKAYYEHAARNFTALSPESRRQKLDDIFDEHKDCIAATFGPDCDFNVFPTFAEITAPRESTAYPELPYSFPPPLVQATPSLATAYCSLLNQPVHHIEPGSKVSESLDRHSGGDKKSWYQLSGEDRWVLQMYGEHCFEHFGGLDIWWAEGVPTEVYKALRGHVWDGGDDDGDDAVSDMTESV